MLNYFDTSALLATNNIETLFGLHDTCYVAHNVIGELENIKNSANKSDEIKMRARRVARFLISHPLDYMCSNFPEKEIEKMRKKFCFPDNTDGRILAEAVCLARKNTVKLFTGDVNMFLFARECGELEVEFVEECCEEQTEVWSGWGKYYPTDEQLNQLYTDPTINILGAKINEYCEVYHEGVIKDVLRWDGKSYVKLKYKDMKNPYTMETIRPRNLEQKFAFDLLQNQDIKVKALFSSWGSGKTMLALTYALEQISHGKYRKIMFVRNNIVCSGTHDVGYLPSGLREKMSIWNRNIADHVGGDDMMTQIEDEGLIETFPISHMRGRSLGGSTEGSGVICIVDEAENLTAEHITLLMSRIEETSEIIFCGDASQCDFSSHRLMGMNKMINALAGDPLFGAVKLIKSERGPVPRLCDKIIPPR